MKEREIYLSTPILLNERTTIEALSGASLKEHFPKHKRLLIWGEGGSGKTALACQIAQWAMSDRQEDRLTKHRMLAVLLEEDLVCTASPGESLCLDAIRGQLQSSIDDPNPISPFLFKKLLATQCILVIVDHLSEMSEETRQTIRPELPDFGIMALIVTSRLNEPLGHLTKATIQPIRIEGDRISSFMHHYFLSLGKRNLFSDAEFFMHCEQLSRIVVDAIITPLLARLYADQVVQAKEKSARAVSTIVAENIPDLMLSYINTLNKGIHEKRLDDRLVHQIVKCVAWQCIKAHFEPSAASRQEALHALNSEHAEEYLAYLEDRLHLVHTIGAAEDHIRFALDPVAEYLAALYIVAQLQRGTAEGDHFLSLLSQVPQSFGRVLVECCQALGVENQLIAQLNTRLEAATPMALAMDAVQPK